jgi:hypothetical protein
MERFPEADAGTRTPDPLLTIESTEVALWSAQSRLPSRLAPNQPCRGGAADATRSGRIPTVSAPNRGLGPRPPTDLAQVRTPCRPAVSVLAPEYTAQPAPAIVVATIALKPSRAWLPPSDHCRGASGPAGRTSKSELPRALRASSRAGFDRDSRARRSRVRARTAWRDTTGSVARAPSTALRAAALASMSGMGFMGPNVAHGAINCNHGFVIAIS